MVDKQVGVVEGMSEDVNILEQVLSMLHNNEECWCVQRVWQQGRHMRGLKTLEPQMQLNKTMLAVLSTLQTHSSFLELQEIPHMLIS